MILEIMYHKISHFFRNYEYEVPKERLHFAIRICYPNAFFIYSVATSQKTFYYSLLDISLAWGIFWNKKILGLFYLNTAYMI